MFSFRGTWCAWLVNFILQVEWLCIYKVPYGLRLLPINKSITIILHITHSLFQPYWQWKNPRVVEKCCICSFETTFLCQTHPESFTSQQGYSAFWACRYVMRMFMLIPAQGCVGVSWLFDWCLFHFQFFLFLLGAEFYLQTLAKALANHFESKLLLLDVVDFSCKVIIFILQFLLFDG